MKLKILLGIVIILLISPVAYGECCPGGADYGSAFSEPIQNGGLILNSGTQEALYEEYKDKVEDIGQEGAIDFLQNEIGNVQPIFGEADLSNADLRNLANEIIMKGEQAEQEADQAASDGSEVQDEVETGGQEDETEGDVQLPTARDVERELGVYDSGNRAFMYHKDGNYEVNIVDSDGNVVRVIEGLNEEEAKEYLTGGEYNPQDGEEPPNSVGTSHKDLGDSEEPTNGAGTEDEQELTHAQEEALDQVEGLLSGQHDYGSIEIALDVIENSDLEGARGSDKYDSVMDTLDNAIDAQGRSVSDSNDASYRRFQRVYYDYAEQLENIGDEDRRENLDEYLQTAQEKRYGDTWWGLGGDEGINWGDLYNTGFDPHALPYADRLSITKDWQEEMEDKLRGNWPKSSDWEKRLCEDAASADEPSTGNFYETATTADGMSVGAIYINGEVTALPTGDFIYQMSWMVRVPDTSRETIEFTLYVKGPSTDKSIVLDENGEKLKNIEVEDGDQEKGFRAKTSNITLTQLCIDYEKTSGDPMAADRDEVFCTPFVQEDYEAELPTSTVETGSDGEESEEGTF